MPECRHVLVQVKSNLLWALVYNICAIPLAAGVFLHTHQHVWSVHEESDPHNRVCVYILSSDQLLQVQVIEINIS